MAYFFVEKLIKSEGKLLLNKLSNNCRGAVILISV